MDRVHRWGRKFTWPAMIISPFLPIPSAIIFVIAGWAGMRLITFIILDIIGTLLWVGMLVGLGYELGHHAVVVAQAISHYGLWISIALIVVVVVTQVRSQRRMMRIASEARTRQRSPHRHRSPHTRRSPHRQRSRPGAGRRGRYAYRLIPRIWPALTARQRPQVVTRRPQHGLVLRGHPGAGRGPAPPPSRRP